ncbi:hypothetical protein GT93_17330 [Pseudomonas plecoglossicida]|nr:hypothetical protein GT93_17330 [Pseudomonas plecoglossicida]
MVIHCGASIITVGEPHEMNGAVDSKSASRICDTKVSTLIERRGYTTTRSDFMIQMWEGSPHRILQGWQVE